MIKTKPIFKLSSFLKEEFSEKDNISQILLDKVMDILSNNNIAIKRKRINFYKHAKRVCCWQSFSSRPWDLLK